MGNALLSKPVMAQRVLRVLGRAEDPVAVHLQLAPVGLDELAERVGIPGPGPGRQVGRHHGILASLFLRFPHALTGTDAARAANWALPAAFSALFTSRSSRCLRFEADAA